MNTAVGTAGGAAGGALGGAIGGIIGAPILPPIGGLIGRWLGGAIGRAAGRAAAEALANAMENANEEAEQESAEEAEATCAECGEIDCFTPPDGADPAEFAKQLKEQQDAIKRMSPDELLQNIDRYALQGRGAGDALARRLARDAYRVRRLAEERARLLAMGRTPAQAATEAAINIAREMRDLDVLHTPDLGAGGSGDISGLGNRSINRSIGSQWGKGRADQLRRAAEEAKKQGKDKMDVELEICSDGGQGGASPGGTSPGGGPSPGSGSGAGSGNIPMS